MQPAIMPFNFPFSALCITLAQAAFTAFLLAGSSYMGNNRPEDVSTALDGPPDRCPGQAHLEALSPNSPVQLSGYVTVTQFDCNPLWSPTKLARLNYQ